MPVAVESEVVNNVNVYTGIDDNSNTNNRLRDPRGTIDVAEQGIATATATVSIPTIPTYPNTAATTLIQSIHQLSDRYWHEPDHQGLKVILGYLGGYFLHERNPLWLHVIGPSSSGKTELGLAPIALDLPECHPLDDLTANTLLSGLSKGKQGGRRNSFMHRVGAFGLIYMADFTTFVEKDERMVGAVAGQMRQIYDGNLTKETGVERRDDKDSGWSGRVSWITAMTPGAERKWMRHNGMGERFSILRWRAARDNEQVSRKVLEQSAAEAEQRWLSSDGTVDESVIGPRRWIGMLAERLVKGSSKGLAGVGMEQSGLRVDLLEQATSDLANIEDHKKPYSPSEDMVFAGGLYSLAEIVTQLRSVPSRPDGRNIGQPDMDRESSGRLQHQLLKVARGWAYINRREVLQEDMSLVRRVAEDCIPISKKPIVDVLAQGIADGLWLNSEDIRVAAKYETLEALSWQLQDLAALGVIETNSNDPADAQRKWGDWATEWKFTDQFAELWGRGFKR